MNHSAAVEICKVCGNPFAQNRLIVDGEAYHHGCYRQSSTSTYDACTIKFLKEEVERLSEELQEGHLALDRAGALKEDHDRELTLAERVAYLTAAPPASSAATPDREAIKRAIFSFQRNVCADELERTIDTILTLPRSSAVSVTHLEQVADYVMGDDTSELAKAKAETAYALHCLEREINIAYAAEARLTEAIEALDEINRHCADNGETNADRDGRWAAGIAREALARLVGEPVKWCELCYLKYELHEDREGFHHVVDGERTPCGGDVDGLPDRGERS